MISTFIEEIIFSISGRTEDLKNYFLNFLVLGYMEYF